MALTDQMRKRSSEFGQSPYKLYDPYSMEDRVLFFGREREARTLLSDVVTNRLVVLFATTGSGKTSLINAGVRPELESLGYATYYIRVERDPSVWARNALMADGRLEGFPTEANLATQLLFSADKLERSIVIFFDQFEEFFIHVRDSDEQKRFIAEIARVYNERDSGVHVVFSMREEYFVEMDIFRDQIPAIFRHDSNLRLRWLDQDQAREAIIGPAQAYEIEFDAELVPILIEELSEDGRVEPARLQIVCDTLFYERIGGPITLDLFRKLGGARQILDQRLQEDIDFNLDDSQLKIFEQVIPRLKTEYNTKLPRSEKELLETLDVDPAEFHRLVARLSQKRLIKIIGPSGMRMLEWPSDYLAARTDEILERVRTIFLKRQIENAVNAAKLKKEQMEAARGQDLHHWAEAQSVEDLQALFLSKTEFLAITEDFQRLKQLERLNRLDPEAAEFMFVAALEHGAYMRFWYEEAANSGVNTIWELLQTRIAQGATPSRQPVNTISLLGEINNERSIELLRDSLKQKALASITLNVLGDLESEDALELLEKSLRDPELASETVAVLHQKASPEAIKLLREALLNETPAALQAGRALNQIRTSQLDPGGPKERQLKFRLKTPILLIGEERALRLFRQSLEQGQDLLFWFDKAKEEGVDVWKTLEENITAESLDLPTSRNAVRLLGIVREGKAIDLLKKALQQDDLVQYAILELNQIETAEALEVWAWALTQPHLAWQADRALLRLAESRTVDKDVRKEALHKLDVWQQEKGPVETPEIEEIPPQPPQSKLWTDDRFWKFLTKRISQGKVIPVVGQDFDPGMTKKAIAESLTSRFQYSFADRDNLARVSQYLSVLELPGEVPLRVGEYLEKQNFNDPGGTESYDDLARLPLPIYITTSFDDSLFKALKNAGKRPRRVVCAWAVDPDGLPYDFRLDRDFLPTPTDPLVFYALGHHWVPETLVLTEDDYLDYLIKMSRDDDQNYQYIPIILKAALSNSTTLILGFRPNELDLRVLLRVMLFPAFSLSRYDHSIVLPTDTPATTDSFQFYEYIEKYFEEYSVNTFWGNAGDFLKKLWAQQEEDYTAQAVETKPNLVNSKRVLDVLTKYFNREELIMAADYLDVDQDVLPTIGSTSMVAIELIRYLEKQERLDELVAFIRKERPHIEI